MCYVIDLTMFQLPMQHWKFENTIGGVTPHTQDRLHAIGTDSMSVSICIAIQTIISMLMKASHVRVMTIRYCVILKLN